MEEEEYKLVVDNVHGHIKLYPLAQLIINTSVFKRLKDILQLQGVHEVFPTANHSRFEHSLGTAHLARRLCEKLGVSKEDTDMVEVAGLCHDLGHGPYSHLWEVFVKAANPSYSWEHEESSYKMLLMLIEEQPEIKKFINEDQLLFIKELICGPEDKGAESRGEYPYRARGPDSHYLYEVISNKVTGLDVDKVDYLMRDAQATGINIKFDWERYLEAGLPKLVDFPYSDKDPTIVKRIAVREKVAKTIQQLFSDRVDLHKLVYQHKTVKLIDVMYVDLWQLADPFFTVMGSEGQQLQLSQACQDEAALVKLTDGYIHGTILNSTSEDLQPARDLQRRIQHRRKYHIVGHFEGHFEGSADKYEASLKHFSVLPTEGEGLRARDLTVTKIHINMGMGKNNPVEKALFYEKSSTVGHKMTPQDLKKYVPEEVQETTIYILCRREEEELVKQAKQIVADWGAANNW